MALRQQRQQDRVKSGDTKSTGIVGQIDESLDQKGIDSSTRQAALKPPAADLPKADEAAKPTPTDTSVLLSSIDSNLKKDGKNVDEMPAPPEAAARSAIPRRRRRQSQKRRKVRLKRRLPMFRAAASSAVLIKNLRRKASRQANSNRHQRRKRSRPLPRKGHRRKPSNWNPSLP